VTANGARARPREQCTGKWVGEDAEAWHEGPMRSERKAGKFADMGKCAQRGYEDELVLAMERADKRDVSNLRSRGL
jgi:hypothetical protein